MNRLDKSLHEFYDLANDIRWHSFSEVGVDEAYYDYYYAEDCLYIIRDVMMEQYWFVEASSPVKALQKFNEKLHEMMQAGQMVEEDWE